jgi:hypothetical protein
MFGGMRARVAMVIFLSACGPPRPNAVEQSAAVRYQGRTVADWFQVANDADGA